jgi:hypothetical protein
MLKAKDLPRYFRGEVVTTAVHILNRAPTRALDGKTPFEAWHGETPPVHYFKMFGCIGHVKNTRPRLQKLEDRSCPMIFIGYEHGSKAYCFYNPDIERVMVFRDAIFNEGGTWKWSESHGVDTGPQDSNTFTIEYTEEYLPTTPATEDRSATPHHLYQTSHRTPLPSSCLHHWNTNRTWTPTTTTTRHSVFTPSTQSSPTDPRHQGRYRASSTPSSTTPLQRS